MKLMVLVQLVFLLFVLGSTSGQVPVRDNEDALRDAALALHFTGNIESLDGYAGLEFKNSSLVIWWKGAPEKKVTDLVSQIVKNVAVEFSIAPFSRKELLRDAKTLRQLIRDPANDLHTVGLAINGSGIVVTGNASTSTLLKQLPVEYRKKRSIRLTKGKHQIKVNRYGDTVPLKGGIAMYSDRNFGCTAGFAVQRNGTHYMLSAAHCGQIGDTFYNLKNSSSTSLGVVIGKVELDSRINDLFLIRAANTLRGSFYDGPANTTSILLRRVIGWQPVVGGMSLCKTGRTTGGSCDLKVTITDASYCFNTGQCLEDMAFAESPPGTIAVKSGDSGGPVFTTSTYGAYAVGIIASTNNANRMGFSVVQKAVELWGIDVLKLPYIG